MAREHANIRVDMWNDSGFRALSVEAQLLYIQLLSSSTLTYAGVADWRPKRISILSEGRKPEQVEKAMKELEAGLFVVVDEDSEEAFIRSFFKWDGLLHKPNVAKAMVTAWGKVHSLTLKAVIVHELRRLNEEFSEWRAFEVPEVLNLLTNDSLNPKELLDGRVAERVPGRVTERDASLLTTNYLLLTTDYKLPALTKEALESLFDKAYSAWPKKTERKKSKDKFLQLCQKHDAYWLVEQVETFGDAYSRHVEKQFVPALVVWLNGERWTDELPASTEKLSAVEQSMALVRELEAEQLKAVEQ